MPNYTKLFNSIITSTIWSEDDKTRIIWITMLAMSDKNGEVHASIPGLARVASMTITEAESAIGKLMSPDAYSRTPDNEGRRIAKIDGGWELLNHAKYRLMASKEDEKAATAERVRRHRNRNADVTVRNADVTVRNADVTVRNADVTVSVDIADTDSDTKKNNTLSVTGREEAIDESISEYSEEILKLWQSFPTKSRERSSKKKINDEWRKAKNKPPMAEVIEKVEAWAQSADWKKDNGQFAPGAHLWIKDRKWESDVPSLNQNNGYHPFVGGFKNADTNGHRSLWD